MNIEQKINEILEKNLPKKAHKIVSEYRKVFGGKGLKIAFAASDYEINQVRNQFPQAVSLSLDLDNMELEIQVFGGMGGNRVYCEPDLNNPKEKYLAMAGRKVAFRRPKKEEKFVLRAIEKFAQNWVKVLKENKDVLTHQKEIDYNALLNS